MLDTKGYSQSLFDLCGDFFVLGLRILTNSVELPPPDMLLQRILAMFKNLQQQGHQAGVYPVEVDDARYAIAAYLDEVIQYSNWSGKLDWSAKPLQAVLFNESQAGTHFFNRLEEVRRRNGEALPVFYACLALGFQGEIRLFGGDPESLVEGIRSELFRGQSSVLSPHGARPDDRVSKGKSFPLLPVASITLLVAVIVVALLYFLISSEAKDTLDLLIKLTRGAAT